MAASMMNDAPSVMHHIQDQVDSRDDREMSWGPIPASETTAHRRGPERSDIDVRPLRLMDWLKIASMEHRYDLNAPASETDRLTFSRLMLRKFQDIDLPHAPVLVATVGGQRSLTASLHFTVDRHDQRWTAAYLQSAEALDDDAGLFIALLEHGIAAAGTSGARRLLARVEDTSPVVAPLQTAGFVPFSHESVLVNEFPRPAGRDPHVHRQVAADVWSIQQLYMRTTPRDVQFAEALTSHHWDADDDANTRRGWFYQDDQGVVAYVRVRTWRQMYLLRLMYISERRDTVGPLLQTVMAAFSSAAPRPVLLALREYQHEVLPVAEGLGFQFLRNQMHLVRYTTQSASAPCVVEEGFESLTAPAVGVRRAPSYCAHSARKTGSIVELYPSRHPE